MNIAISGATGFIGQGLSDHLISSGHTITPLTRELFSHKSSEPLHHHIEQADVVINLAGERVNRWWTRARRDSILESRIITTRKIVQAINRCSVPKTLISASAVGYYPAQGCYDETSRVENYSFLSYVCRLWEREALRLNHHSRLVITRFGVVYSHSRGALQQMMATKSLGFLLRIGSQHRAISWVDHADLIRALEFIMHNGEVEGVVNIVAPHLTLQQDLLQAAQGRYNTRLVVPLPTLLLKLLLGQSLEVITHSPCVSSQKLVRAGFEFHSRSIFDMFAL